MLLSVSNNYATARSAVVRVWQCSRWSWTKKQLSKRRESFWNVAENHRRLSWHHSHLWECFRCWHLRKPQLLTVESLTTATHDVCVCVYSTYTYMAVFSVFCVCQCTQLPHLSSLISKELQYSLLQILIVVYHELKCYRLVDYHESVSVLHFLLDMTNLQPLADQIKFGVSFNSI